MKTNEMDPLTKEQISFWTQGINTLLPQRGTTAVANHLFTAACSFLAWTNDFVHVPKIKQGRDAVWGIIRFLVNGRNLDPKTHEVAVALLDPNSRGNITLLKETVGRTSNAAS